MNTPRPIVLRVLADRAVEPTVRWMRHALRGPVGVYTSRAGVLAGVVAVAYLSLAGLASAQESEVQLTTVGEDPLIFTPPSGPPAHLEPPPLLPAMVPAPWMPPELRALRIATGGADESRRPPSSAALAALGAGGEILRDGEGGSTEGSPSHEGSVSAVEPAIASRGGVDLSVGARASWIADRVAAVVAARLRLASADLQLGLAGDIPPAAEARTLRVTAGASAGPLSFVSAGSWHASAGGRVAATARWHAASGEVGGAASFASVADTGAGEGSSHGEVGVDWRTAGGAPIGARLGGAVSVWSELGVATWAADLEAALLTTQWLPAVGLEAGAALSISAGGATVAPVAAAHAQIGTVVLSLVSGRLQSATRWLLETSVPGGSMKSVAPLRQQGWYVGGLIAFPLGAAASELAGALSFGGGYAAGELLRFAYGAQGDLALEQQAGTLWWCALDAAGEGARWRAKLRAVVGYGQHSDVSAWSPEVGVDAALRASAAASLEWVVSIDWRPGPHYAAVDEWVSASGLPRPGDSLQLGRSPRVPSVAVSILPLNVAVGAAVSLDAWRVVANVGVAWDRTDTLGVRAEIGVASTR